MKIIVTLGAILLLAQPFNAKAQETMLKEIVAIQQAQLKKQDDSLKQQSELIKKQSELINRQNEELKSLTSRISAQADSSVGMNGNLNFGTRTRQMLNLYSSSYGIGIQNGTEYFRTNANFAFYLNGSHSDQELDPGGGSTLMSLNSEGKLNVKGPVLSQGAKLLTRCNLKTSALNSDRPWICSFTGGVIVNGSCVTVACE